MGGFNPRLILCPCEGPLGPFCLFHWEETEILAGLGFGGMPVAP
jgi:hypothetical protein